MDDHKLFPLVKWQQSMVVYLHTLLTGPGCSKLTTLLVNVSLSFQKLISQICQYFFASLIFSTKSFSVFVYKVVKHLTGAC